jgi:sodium-coupled neutral amino acid transporter 7/8
MLVFITGSFVMLAYCADKSGAQNYQEIVRDFLGGKFYILTQICVLIYMFGTSIAYMILIADQLEKGEDILCYLLQVSRPRAKFFQYEMTKASE